MGQAKSVGYNWFHDMWIIGYSNIPAGGAAALYQPRDHTTCNSGVEDVKLFERGICRRGVPSAMCRRGVPSAMCRRGVPSAGNSNQVAGSSTLHVVAATPTTSSLRPLQPPRVAFASPRIRPTPRLPAVTHGTAHRCTGGRWLHQLAVAATGSAACLRNRTKMA